MYDDAVYTFMPSAQAPRSPTEGKGKHKRRESLLKQPNEKDKNGDEIGNSIEAIQEEVATVISPPQATVARRAKSYSDFYDIVREHVRKEYGKDGEKPIKTKENLETELEFEDWYAQMTDELLDASHGEYRQYQNQLAMAQSHITSLLNSNNATIDLLSSLSDAFQAVEIQTTEFQDRCEGILAEQKRIAVLAEDLDENLRYYTYLEPITRRLNAPGAGNFVRGHEYAEMLSNLDNCLDYMQAHPKQRDAATYQARYRLLLTRGLTLIRVHFTNSIREIAADVSKRIADQQLNDTTMSALLYAKFRSGAPDLKRIGLEIQKRAVPPMGDDQGAEAEYQSLMNELYQSYSAARGRLILPIVMKKVNEIAMAPSSANDVVAFARSVIGYARSVCVDEYELWGNFFHSEGALYDFLESLLDPVYDHLRPRTIKETQITKLCELCTLIQTRYMEGEDDEDDEDEAIDQSGLNFSTLIRPTLEDAQSRLVFLVLAKLRDDIERYKPKPEDLDYPARNRNAITPTGKKASGPALSGRKSSMNGDNKRPKPLPAVPDGDDADDDLVGFTNAGLALKDAYPTLRKAVWLLSKIYRMVNSTVFDDLAHQILHQCTTSLITASSTIRTKSSPADGHLFLISHLLSLKQQIVAFDIEYVAAPDVSFDFSSISNTFWELQRERGGLFNPSNLYKLVVGGGLVPRVVENMLDAKVELDGQLRHVINDFVSEAAARMTDAVSGDVSSPTFDSMKALSTVQTRVKADTPALRRKLSEYLADGRTRETLVAAVMDQVLQNYEDFYERFTAAQRARGARSPASKKGKGRADEVWDPDAFLAWCEPVFEVGRTHMGFDEGEDQDDDGHGSGSGSGGEGSVSST